MNFGIELLSGRHSVNPAMTPGNASLRAQFEERQRFETLIADLSSKFVNLLAIAAATSRGWKPCLFATNNRIVGEQGGENLTRFTQATGPDLQNEPPSPPVW
jgi:hypothetical protein